MAAFPEIPAEILVAVGSLTLRDVASHAPEPGFQEVLCSWEELPSEAALAKFHPSDPGNLLLHSVR